MLTFVVAVAAALSKEQVLVAVQLYTVEGDYEIRMDMAEVGNIHIQEGNTLELAD